MSKFSIGQEEPRFDAALGAGFFHLYCAGGLGVTFSKFRWQGDLKLASKVALLDRQLRMWTATSGASSLPTLASNSPHEAPSIANPFSAVSVQWSINGAGELEANRVAPSSEVGQACLSFLRPLCNEEQLEYEFYFLPGQCMVQPVLGRLGFMLEENGIALHWMANPAEFKILGLPPENRVPLAPPLLISNPKLIADAWNKVLIRMEENCVSIGVNNSEVARVPLKESCNRQFGLLFDPNKHYVRVRDVILSGDWPEKLPISELTGAQ